MILHCKPGPTLQIRHEEYARPAWDKLKTLYDTQGFTSEFLLCNEFFNSKPENFKSLESYLNEVKRLTEELKSRDLELPSQIIISWILANLGEEFEGFVLNITQSFRKDSNAYDFDTLTSTILDEAKRHKHMNYANTVIKPNSNSNSNSNKLGKGVKNRVSKKNSWKKEKGQICRLCNRTSHQSQDCYLLHPEKAPEAWQRKFLKLGGSVPNSALKRREKSVKALIANLALSDTSRIQDSDEAKEFVNVTITDDTDKVNQALILSSSKQSNRLTDLNFTRLSEVVFKL